jgi:hypothetical protein
MAIKVHVSETIDRAPGDVFAVLADVQHHTDWARGPQRIENLSENPAQLGTTWTQISKLVGREVEIHARVDAYDAGREFGFQADKPIPVHMRWQLEPAGSGTTVNLTVEGEPGGFFGVATPLLRKALTDTVTSDLATLKKRLETHA